MTDTTLDGVEVEARKCRHARAEYRAEYVMGDVLLRDFLACGDCGQEFSMSRQRWGAPIRKPALGLDTANGGE